MDYDMTVQQAMENPPKCEDCGDDKRLIGVDGGKVILQCKRCTGEAIKAIMDWEPGSENTRPKNREVSHE